MPAPAAAKTDKDRRAPPCCLAASNSFLARFRYRSTTSRWRRRQHGKRTPCASTLGGDYNYRTCAKFCNATKGTKHCGFCKCADCPFCLGGAHGGGGGQARGLLGTPTGMAGGDPVAQTNGTASMLLMGMAFVFLGYLVAKGPALMSSLMASASTPDASKGSGSDAKPAEAE